MTKGTQLLMTSAFAALIGLPAVAQEAALANITCAAFAALDDDTRANALTQIAEVYMAQTAETGDGAVATNEAETATDEAMADEGTDTTTDAAEAPVDDAAAEPETTDGAAATDTAPADDTADATEASADLSAEIAAACEGNDDAEVLSVLQASTD